MDHVTPANTPTPPTNLQAKSDLQPLHITGGTIPGDITVRGTTNLGKVNVSGPLTLTGTTNELFFQDGGQIRSLDNNHRILFRRPENKLEIREYGDIILSPGATGGSETAKAVLLANGNLGIGTTNPSQKLEVNGTVAAHTFVGNGFSLEGSSGAAWSTIEREDVDVRSAAVDLCHIRIAVPVEKRFFIMARFDGTCIGSNGDRIMLAASDTSKQWQPKAGRVSVLFNTAQGLEQHFSHTRVFFVPISNTHGFLDYYAVVQNSGEMGGTGKATIYGTFTLQIYTRDFADW
ncbi:hypothetical protein L4X63_13600 [Geomonas sp. Red32]|uniref:hypothetical protein n=1 Tax=Geomonas sp. Red32 TaxID=2912856 RepID=UPI00202CF221|nr:hypothetical protein [Geomonas sp. Red32]MCM0082630.1 hypothetical protein [Geomonas sp. Red32]